MSPAALSERTQQAAHAAFIQHQFTLDLFWRIRFWKHQGRPKKR